jgi:hypothetical protein
LAETQQGDDFVAPAPGEALKPKNGKDKAGVGGDGLDEHVDALPAKPKRRVNRYVQVLLRRCALYTTHVAHQGASLLCTREYVPTFRSGAYAIVRCLYQAALEGDELPKADIQRDGQQWADASFTVVCIRPKGGMRGPCALFCTCLSCQNDCKSTLENSFFFL